MAKIHCFRVSLAAQVFTSTSVPEPQPNPRYLESPLQLCVEYHIIPINYSFYQSHFADFLRPWLNHSSSRFRLAAAERLSKSPLAR